MKLLSAPEVAKLLDCNRSTVFRAATANDVGTLVGTVRGFSQSDVRRLRKLINPTPGNPNVAEMNRKNPPRLGKKKRVEVEKTPENKGNRPPKKLSENLLE